MERSPTSEAKRLVDRARRKARGHEMAGAILAGLTVAALVATVAAAVSRLAGVPLGSWLCLALAPGLALALVRLKRRMPTAMRAALLLDRAAGTKERFAAVLDASDEEVRELVAAQAVASPAVADGAMPVSFPPSTEGLLAAVSLVALAAVLLLDGRSNSPATGPSATPLPATAHAVGDPDAPADPTAGPPPTPSRDPDGIIARLERGEPLSKEDWAELERRGLTGESRDSARSAAEEGDGAAAAAAVRRALEAAAVPPPASPDPDRDWARYQHAMEAPVWDPRFDDVVKRYFNAAK